MQNWQTLVHNSKTLNSTAQSLHQAAQFVAMVSNSYLPKLSDDSQNNLGWNFENNQLEGRWLESSTTRALLDVGKFEIVINKLNLSTVIPLDGWTKEQVISNLLDEVIRIGLNSELLKPITQFTIPAHAVDAGHAFTKPDTALLDEWSRYLSNTQIVLKEIQSEYKGSSEIRVWPHHFDMGLYLPIAKDELDNDIQSIGIGLAIADSYVDEPHFYINHWSKSILEYPQHLPKVCCGYWNIKDWKGLVLPSSAVLAQDRQYNLVKNFFNERNKSILTTAG